MAGFGCVKLCLKASLKKGMKGICFLQSLVCLRQTWDLFVISFLYISGLPSWETTLFFRRKNRESSFYKFLRKTRVKGRHVCIQNVDNSFWLSRLLVPSVSSVSASLAVHISHCSLTKAFHEIFLWRRAFMTSIFISFCLTTSLTRMRVIFEYVLRRQYFISVSCSSLITTSGIVGQELM